MIASLRRGAAAALLPALLASPTIATSAADVACYRNKSASSTNPELAQLERGCLSKIAMLAQRSGNTLSVSTVDGQKKTFESKPDACEAGDTAHCSDYRLVEYIQSLDTIVIERSSYESRDFLLIDRQQAKTFDTGDRPNVSPDRSTFVVALSSERGDPNGIEIWTKQHDALAKEWSYYAPPEAYKLYAFERWIGNDQVALTVEERVKPNSELTTRKLRLKRSAKGWSRLSG